MPAKKSKSKDKRMKVDAWISDGVRLAIAADLGVSADMQEGRAGDYTVRNWVQNNIDQMLVDVCDEHADLLAKNAHR